MLKPGIGIKQITIIASGGVPLYHREYEKGNYDGILFSGMSTALLSFSSDLGHDLNVIKTSGLNLHFYKTNKSHIVLALDPELDDQDVISSLFEKIDNSGIIEEMLNNSYEGTIVDLSQSYDKVIDQLLFEKSGRRRKKAKDGSKDLTSINQYTEDFQKLRREEVTIKSLALKYIREDISKKEADSKSNSIDMISSIMDQFKSDDVLYGKLEELLKLMQQRALTSAAKALEGIF